MRVIVRGRHVGKSRVKDRLPCLFSHIRQESVHLSPVQGNRTAANISAFFPGWAERQLDFRSTGGLRHSAIERRRDSQNGPLIVCLHANSLCAATWVPVVNRLPKQVDAIAVDLRAHGDSDAPAELQGYSWESFGSDVRRIVTAVSSEYGRPVDACVTHSFIGDCALIELAAEGAYSAKQMILLDPVLSDAEGASAGAERLAKGTRRLGQREEAGFDSAEQVGASFEKLLKASLAKEALHPEAKAAFAFGGAFCDDSDRWRLKCRRENEAEVYARRIAIADHLQTRQVDATVRLAFASKRRGKAEDQNANFQRDMDVARRVIARCSPSSAVQVMEDVGHFLVLEDPAAVAELIRSVI